MAAERIPCVIGRALRNLISFDVSTGGWRDFDAFGHVKNSVYLDDLEEVRDEWLELVVAKQGLSWDFVLVRVVIDFRRELLVARDHEVELARLGRSSVHTRDGVRTSGASLRSGRSPYLWRATAVSRGRSR